jgi:hypothetical protein
MRRLILPLLFFLVSCGSDNDKDHTPIHNARRHVDFLPYITAFERDYGMRIRDSIGFTYTNRTWDEGKIGYCDGKNITINHKAWHSNIEDIKTLRWVTVYHELGHCELHRAHLDTMLGVGIPISLMHSTFHGKVYDTYRPYYVLELFRRIPDRVN